MNQDQQDKFLDQHFDLIVKQQQVYLDKRQPQQLVQDDNLTCQVCFEPFSSKRGDNLCPLILSDCGHTFCTNCIKKFFVWSMMGIRYYKCPLDKVENYKATTNYLVLNMVESCKSQQQRKLSLSQNIEPNCQQHIGQQLIFYNPTDSKFYCQTCIQSSADNFASLKDYVFISYEKLKPQILKRLEERVSAIPNTQAKFQPISMTIIQDIQQNLLNDLQKKRDEVIRNITEETQRKMDQIKKTFTNEVYQTAIKISNKLQDDEMEKQKAKKEECQRFLRSFGNLLSKNSENKRDEVLNYRQFFDNVTTVNIKIIDSDDAVRQASSQVIEKYQKI